MQIWSDKPRNAKETRNNLIVAFKKGMQIKQIPKAEQPQEYQQFLIDFGLHKDEDFER